MYAIPYEGEEVKLHWANADQYYIKTSEYLRDYAFRLRPEDKTNPMRVHFRLVDAAEGEHGNVKEAAGKERRFRLAPENPMSVENGELVVRFTYQPDPAKQKDLNTAAEQAIFKARDASLAEWLHELGRKHARNDGTESQATRLRVHLDRYTARNTFDYFIHKNLGGFLRRELDFYIKNEVMYLDDVEHEPAPRVEQYLSKLKVIRRFDPDFIVWQLVPGRQHVSFVDPKGIGRLPPDDPKIAFYETVKDIEARLGDPNVVLNSFIVSNTPSHVKRKQWGIEKPEMVKRHILFQHEDRASYIAAILPPPS